MHHRVSAYPGACRIHRIKQKYECLCVIGCQVMAHGPGLQAEGVVLNTLTEFTVDASKAGQVAPLDIVAVDADSNPVEVKVTDNKNRTYTCKYTPVKATLHTICISYGGVSIPNSPFKVAASTTDTRVAC